MSLTSVHRSHIVGLVLALVTTVVVSSASPASSASPSLIAVEPARLVETRSTASEGTIDGQSFGDGRLEAGTVTSFVAAGRAAVPGDATAVVLNVAIVGPADQGFATVFPCPSGTPSADDAPNASSVNMASGRTVANSLLVRVGVAGRVCVYSSTSAHLVVDVSGYTSGKSPAAVDPARLVETRPEAAPTIDGASSGEGSLRAGAVHRFSATDRGGVPSNAAAVALNVAAVRPEASGFITVFPCPGGVATAKDAPTASNLNFTAGRNVANSVMTSVGSDGDVCVYTSAATHVVVDVNGYVPAGGDPRPFAPIRLLETRPADASATIDGGDVGAGRLQRGSVTALQVAGRGPIEATSSAVVVNVTVVSPSSQGYVTLFPCPSDSASGSDVPTASNVNFSAGQTVANSAFVGVGAGGQVCIYTSTTTHLVVDVSASAPGEQSPSGGPVPVTPVDPPTTPTTTPPTGPSPTTNPPPSTTPPPTTSPPPTTNPGPQPPTTGPHTFTATVRGEPVRWDPCSTITYKVDFSRGTQADYDELNAAIARLEVATGLDFVDKGTYSATYSPASARAPRPNVPSGAEVGLTLTDNDVASDFANGLLGYAIIQWSNQNGEIVAGTVTLDATPSSGIDKELVWMHELAHLVGLGHVDAAGELMQPRLDRALDGFGDGDREGLWRIGAAQPCLFSEVQRDPDLRTTFSEFGPDGHTDH